MSPVWYIDRRVYYLLLVAFCSCLRNRFAEDNLQDRSFVFKTNCVLATSLDVDMVTVNTVFKISLKLMQNIWKIWRNKNNSHISRVLVMKTFDTRNITSALWKSRIVRDP